MSREDRMMIEHLEKTVKQLAMERAMILKTEVMDEDEVTKFINEKGEKYAKKFERMGVGDIIFEGLMEIARYEAEGRRDGE